MRKRAMAAAVLACILAFTGCGENKIGVAVTETVTEAENGNGNASGGNGNAAGENGNAASIEISEVMAGNDRAWFRTTDDWIELYNPESYEVELSGYVLSDGMDPDGAVKDLAGQTIPAGGYLAVTLGEDDAFHLSGDGESVYLFRNRELIDSLTYDSAIGSASWGKDGLLDFVTPGFANTEEGYQEYLSVYPSSPLLITEVVSQNSTYEAPDGNCYDLVELKNVSDNTVTLSDYYLSDDRDSLAKAKLPETTLAAGEYAVIYCSGGEGDSQAAFKISSSGETVYLSDGEEILDAVCVPGDLEENKSYGRSGEQLVYMEIMTPGAENAEGYLSRVKAPTASLESGMYTSKISVSLSGEGTIYYTTDGSRPTVNSKQYTGPITIRDMASVRAICVDGERKSEEADYTYLIGKEHTLPVLTVSIPDSDLSGSSGILTNYEQTIEKECLLTYFVDGEEQFSVPCGFRLHGNDSRKLPKQNFQLRFRSEYGPGKLHYKLFDDLELEEFDSLLLKGGSEDYNRAMMIDELCCDIVRGNTELYALAMQPVILYLGDEYWGIYYIRERFSADYVADHFDVSEESVDVLYGSGSVQDGSANDWNELISYVKNHDMSTSESYEYVASKVELNSLMDWYICRSYMGDKDLANVRFFRTTDYDGKWRWMWFDLDWAFYHTTDKPLTSIIKDNSQHVLIRGLMKNAEFRDSFLKRYAKLMDTCLNEEYITAKIDYFVSFLEPEMAEDRARWGGSVETWRNTFVEKLYAYVRDGARDENVLKDLKSYFNLSDAEMKEYFGDKYQS